MRFAPLAAFLIGLSVLLRATVASAYEVEERQLYRVPHGDETLRIISTADRNVFEPIILAFQRLNPTVDVEYVICGTTELMKALYEEKAPFDLAVSSAMDLQIKLANDGFAQTYRSEATEAMPDWARWHDQVFAFTQEPAVLVVSTEAFKAFPVPSTREDLITLLRDNPERFSGRIGTYDVRRSGAGYLFATQDSRNTDSFWRLTEVMGRLKARLYPTSGEMIADVAEGRLDLAYNVVGSYAASRQASMPGIRIVLFDDYVNVVLRTVLIPHTALSPPLAGRMVDFLVGLHTRPDLSAVTFLQPVKSEAVPRSSASRRIRLGPGLLVFLDKMKRDLFLRNWTSSMVQE